MDSKNYYNQQEIKNAIHLRELQEKFPCYCEEFFSGIKHTTSSSTRIAYAYDLNVFFEYLITHNIQYKDKKFYDITLNDLDNIKAIEIKSYLEYLNYYFKDKNRNQPEKRTNNEIGKARKLSTIRSFYKYFYKKGMIKNNPTLLVELPKVQEKHIVRLDVDEIVKLIEEVKIGDNLTDCQKRYHYHTKSRDLAIITLLLGTGIRVSECVGLNLLDIDFDVNSIRIIRKGRNEELVFFGEKVKDILISYLELRNKKIPQVGHKEALFISLQNKRLSIRSVQYLVKKYSKLVTKQKKISPQKLRNTYGTNLYRETGNIYLVADVLGNRDVNVAKKYTEQFADEKFLF